MLYEIKKKYYWPKIEEFVKDYPCKCKECVANDQKKHEREDLVKTTKPLELVAIDLMFITQKVVVLKFIDYFTRLCRAVVIENKKSETIKQELVKILKKWEIQRWWSVITEEFISSDLKQYFESQHIKHHKVSLEKHQVNGRVERIHRTSGRL